MSRSAFDVGHRPAEAGDGPIAVGVDAGATLAKIAVQEAGGELSYGYLPASARDAVVRRVQALAPARIGLTGCGASHLERLLGESPEGAGRLRRVVEFEAWGCGADRLLAAEDFDTGEPYLLVSLGTGTSVLRVEAGHASRLGGTALGGGTVLGLGVALTGCESYEELCTLASSGQRGNVDLLVQDIYQPGEIALPGGVTAASFGSLARWLTHDRDEPGPASREDLAAAVMGLVGENVALVCAGLARAAGVERVVYGGATLVHNATLAAIVLGVTAASGLSPLLLSEGGHAGAVGALTIATRASELATAAGAASR